MSGLCLDADGVRNLSRMEIGVLISSGLISDVNYVANCAQILSKSEKSSTPPYNIHRYTFCVFTAFLTAFSFWRNVKILVFSISLQNRVLILVLEVDT